MARRTPHEGGPNAITPGSPTGGIPLKVANGYDPVVSPDGSRIAYVSSSKVWTMRRDGSDKRILLPGSSYQNDDPAWSPDGTQIAYSSRATGRLDIYAVAATGGTPRALTNDPDNEENNPVWSPDGRQIAYDRTGCDIPRGGGSCVYVMNADGSGQTNLTPSKGIAGCERQPGYSLYGSTREPAWSPDGTKISFTGPPHCTAGSSGTDIWIMGHAGAGAGAADLTPGHGTNDAQSAFSPDGTSIVFTNRGIALYTIPANGGARQQITSGSDYRPHWAVAPPPPA